MEWLPVDDRTILRLPRVSDATGLHALIVANRAHLRWRVPWADADASVDDIAASIHRYREIGVETKEFTGMIEHGGQLCGVASLNRLDGANRSACLSYWIREDRQGRGIVTGCCRALLRYAFVTLELNRVNVLVAVDNRRSRAIPERLGFHLDGIIRDGEWLGNRFVDQAFYTLLRREFGPPE